MERRFDASTIWAGVHMLLVRFICRGIYPVKKVERFPAWMAIQDTDEPSSDRLIQEGRPHLRRLSFFSDFGIVFPAAEAGRLPPRRLYFPLDFFRETGIG